MGSNAMTTAENTTRILRALASEMCMRFSPADRLVTRAEMDALEAKFHAQRNWMQAEIIRQAYEKRCRESAEVVDPVEPVRLRSVPR